ncbi:MAG: class C sortase [Streptococcaceae bacterium]|jgi:sortase A|nr:class C sortase [Streptococcaceae bacterium]
MKSTKLAIFQFVLQIVVVVLALGGTFVATYPFVASSLNDFWSAQIQKNFDEELAAMDKQAQKTQKINDERVAKQLSDPYSFESLTNIRGDNYPNKWYVEQMIGEIFLPTINEHLTVFEDAVEPLLQRGVGWVQGSDYPSTKNKEGTHSVVAGHSGLPHARLFNDITQLKKGDLFIYYMEGEYFAYEVISSKIVKPDKVEQLQPVQGENLSTLVTCVPIGINSHRLLVTGSKVPFTPQMASLISGIQQRKNVKNTFLTTIILASLIIGLLVLRNGYRLLKMNKMLGNLLFHDEQYKDVNFAPDSDFQLFSGKGEVPLKRDGVYFVASRNENKEVQFEKLPARNYLIKENGGKGRVKWQLFFKPVIEKEHYYIVEGRSRYRKKRKVLGFKCIKKRKFRP